MRMLLASWLLKALLPARAQPAKTPADFGYRYLRLRYQHDAVDVPVLSESGRFPLTRTPVFVAYGARSNAAVGNGCPRREISRAGKSSFTFWAYTGLEHNFAGCTNGQVD